MIVFFLIFLLSFISVSSDMQNNLIVDYFFYKNTFSVVGFSCNVDNEDLLLVKKFNEIGVSATISKANYESRVNRFAHTIYQKLGIFFDVQCYDTETIMSIFSEAGDYGMYDDLHYWFVIGSNMSSISDIIDDTAFGYSTNFVFAIPSLFSTGYELYDIYNLWKEREMKLNIDSIGFWDQESQINIEPTTRFERRANLQGLIVRASFYQILEPLPANVTLETYLQDNSKITSDSVSKFGFTIMSHLADMLNFKVQSKLAEKWQKGDPLGPTVQAVIKKECDITGTPALITQKRLNVIKFTYQLYPHRTCFIFRSPQPTVIQAEQILGPLDLQVWLLTTAVIVLSACTLAFALRFEEPNEGALMRYSHSVLTTLGALCQQGTDMQMNLTSTRCIYFCIIFFSFLLYNYYSAIIVSIRLNEPIFQMNDSLVGLAKTNLKLASEWMEFFELYIKQKDREIEYLYNNRWKNIPKNEQFLEPNKALLLVQKGGYAYHTNPNVAYSYINHKFDEREICELTEVHLLRPIFIDFGVDYNSTIVEMLRVGISRISEVGLRKRQVIRWKIRKPECNRDALRASSITFFEFAPHLILLSIGMVLAAIVFVLELINKRYIN